MSDEETRRPEIVFGDHDLYHPTRKSKVLRGVAFVDDDVVWFEPEVSGYVRLKIEAISAARHVYGFFNKIFKKYRRSDVGRHAGLSKQFSCLLADWWIEKESWDNVLKEVKQKMSEEWESAFKELLKFCGI